jgi:hypothetical protein
VLLGWVVMVGLRGRTETTKQQTPQQHNPPPCVGQRDVLLDSFVLRMYTYHVIMYVYQVQIGRGTGIRACMYVEYLQYEQALMDA